MDLERENNAENIKRPMFPFAIDKLFDGRTFWNRDFGPGSPWPFLATKITETSSLSGDISYFGFANPESGTLVLENVGPNDEDDRIETSSVFGFVIPNPILGNDYAVSLYWCGDSLEPVFYKNFTFTVSEDQCYEGSYNGADYCIACYACAPNLNDDGSFNEQEPFVFDGSLSTGVNDFGNGITKWIDGIFSFDVSFSYTPNSGAETANPGEHYYGGTFNVASAIQFTFL